MGAELQQPVPQAGEAEAVHHGAAGGKAEGEPELPGGGAEGGDRPEVAGRCLLHEQRRLGHRDKGQTRSRQHQAGNEDEVRTGGANACQQHQAQHQGADAARHQLDRAAPRCHQPAGQHATAGEADQQRQLGQGHLTGAVALHELPEVAGLQLHHRLGEVPGDATHDGGRKQSPAVERHREDRFLTAALDQQMHPEQEHPADGRHPELGRREAAHGMADAGEKQHHRQGDADQARPVGPQVTVGWHLRQKRRDQGQAQQGDQGHQAQGQPPAAVRQHATQKRAADEAHDDQQVPHPQGLAQLLGPADEAHRGEREGQNSAHADAHQGAAQEKHPGIGGRQGDAIAGDREKERPHQHLTAAEAIAQKTHQQHGGGLGQGRDAGGEGQGGALHVQRLSGLHQSRVGHGRVDQLQAGQHPQKGHRQGMGGFLAHAGIREGAGEAAGQVVGQLGAGAVARLMATR